MSRWYRKVGVFWRDKGRLVLKVKFWGVNGSIPSPCNSADIQAKIRRCLELSLGQDLASEEKLENFLATLPHDLKGTYKGNTSCVQVVSADGIQMIFDAGTGIKPLAHSLMGSPLGRGQGEVHLFLSHLHWDHIQGFPFFIPVYIPGNTIHIYAVIENLKEKFRNQMVHPYFPVLFDQLGATLIFHELKEGEELTLSDGKIRIRTEKLYHPQVSHAFSVTEADSRFVYMTDSEFDLRNMSLIQKAAELTKDADVFIFDCQYTFQETISKMDWGHSSVFTGIDIASSANAKRLFLFHHEPAYGDGKISNLIREGQKYLKITGNENLQIFGAYDGLEIEI